MKTLFPLPASRAAKPESNSDATTESAVATNNQAVVAQHKLITFAQAAEQMSVSLNHVRNLIKDGHLTSVSVGARGKRLRLSDIEAIVNHGVSQRGRRAH